MPTITFHFNGQTQKVETEPGKTILQIALDNGIPIEHACGGNGFCTTCLCTVKNNGQNLSERNEKEENMGVIEENERLGCQAEVNGDTEIEIVET